MGEYIVSGFGEPFGSHDRQSWYWKVVDSGDVGADDIAMYLSDYTDPNWPIDWQYRTDFMVAVNSDKQLFWSTDGENWTEITGTTNVTYDGNTYTLKLQGTNVCYGPAAPSLENSCPLSHFDPDHPNIATIQNNLGGMLNGYAEEILTDFEWDKYQASKRKCDWTMYKDSTCYYLTWDSAYIENNHSLYHHIVPSDVTVEYQYYWKFRAPDSEPMNYYGPLMDINFTNEPLQFNIQTIMKAASANKFDQWLQKFITVPEFGQDTRYGIQFRLKFIDQDDSVPPVFEEVTTDACFVEFNYDALFFMLNKQDATKSISDVVADYSAAVSDGSTVTLKDGYFADDPDYEGPGDGTDNGYTDPTVPSDTLGTTTAYGNNNILTTAYAMTAYKLNQLGAFLWGNSFESAIHKINSSPLENIVSLRCYPFDMSGTGENIYLGNVDSGVSGDKLADNYNPTFSVGSVTIEGFYNSFLDYEPYTSLKIFLPFCGMKDLDLNYCMGKTLSVEYVVDIGTGTGSINIYVDTVLTYTYSCNIGFEIPLSSTNSGQVAGALMSNAASTAVAVAVEAASENYLAMAGTLVTAGIKAATTKHTTSTSGNFSANVWGRMPRTCYIVYDRPTYQNIALFNHTYGRMCNQSRVIGSLSGFTMITNLDLSGIAIMTKEEEDIIRELFRDGIYV